MVWKYHVTWILPDAYTPLPSSATRSPGSRWRPLSLTKTEISLLFYMQIIKCRKIFLFTGSFYFVNVQIGSAPGSSFTPQSQALQQLCSCGRQETRLNLSQQCIIITVVHATSMVQSGEPWLAGQGKFLCCSTCCRCGHGWNVVSRWGPPSLGSLGKLERVQQRVDGKMARAWSTRKGPRSIWRGTSS